MGGPNGRRPTNKRRKTNNEPGIDSASLLPEALFFLILQRLDIDDLVSARLVSKHWRATVISHLSAVPAVLRFDELEYVTDFVDSQVPNPIPDFYGSTFRTHLINSGKRRFIDFVSRTLLAHKQCTIGSVNLCLCYDGTLSCSQKLTHWVTFLLTSKIGEVYMDFSSGGWTRSLYPAHHFDLPTKNFSPRTLVSLSLTLCNVRANTFGVMVSLKTLKFAKVKFFGCSFGKIASRCPTLEAVELSNCVFPNDFMMCARDLRIKRLSIIACRTEQLPMFSICISTPELLSFKFFGRYLMMSAIRNASRLQYASIEVMKINADHVKGDAVASLLSGLSHCRTISLNSWCIQVLPTGDDLKDELYSPLTYVQHLKLAVGLEKEELPGITCLIRSCPNLKTITINLESSMVFDQYESEDDVPDILEFEEETYWQSQSLPFQCMETTLKQILITGFGQSVKMYNMARFFLANAAALKKMDIYIDSPSLRASNATEEQISTMWYEDSADHPIQMIPRLSQHAQVRVFMPFESSIEEDDYYSDED